MKVLVFGAQGWIGQQFLANTKHEVVKAKTRPENYAECEAEIAQVMPDSVASFIGRTHGHVEDGSLVPTIDYLEHPGKLRENMRDNYIAPIHLAAICASLSIQFVYLGTGCIYSYTDDKKLFSEESVPNFFGSSYSIIKGYTDQEIRRYPTTLQLRIRMPISRLVSSRNLIDKLVAYKNICSIPNSMTVLDDMWPIIDRMIEKGTLGSFNMVNPGVAEHRWILNLYKSLLNPSHTWVDVSYDEQMKHIKSHRSNNELTTDKLEAFCKEEWLELPEITNSISACLQARLPF
jgi:3,5-epimerase/4-reductase